MADTDTDTDTDTRAKLAELLKGKRIAMLTTTDIDGTFASRPMALQESEFDGDLWFFSERDSRKVSQGRSNPGVNVTVADSGEWVSLNGTMQVVDDLAKKRELWNKGVEAWFPDGPEDDDIVLLKIDADSAEYWDTPGGGGIATALSLVKTKLGGKPAGGENEKVEL